MSIFKQLKSLFIVEESEGDSSKPTEQHNTSKENVVFKKSSESVDSKDTDKFVDILFRAIESNNLEGYDYLEFIQSINNLKKQGLSSEDKQLFNTAFALAKTMNVGKKDLIKSADFYLTILNKEKANFNESLVNNAKVKLQEKTNVLNSLNKQLQSDKQLLDKLRLKIERNEKEAEKITNELQQAGAKVNSIKAGFENALKQITGKILKDKTKIEKYLN